MTGALARIHAKCIIKAWPLLIWLVPIICIIFVAVGFPSAEIEDRVFNIWVRTGSEYRADVDYIESVAPPSGSSTFLALAVPRAGGNAITAELLLELRDKSKKMEEITLTQDGITFTYEDFCSNAVSAYDTPCLRMSVLDCFQEGGYNFKPVHAEAWRELVAGEFDVNALLADLDKPIIETGLMLFSCNANCIFDGQHPALAEFIGAQAGTWDSEITQPVCHACISGTYAALDDAGKEDVYYRTGSLMVGFLEPGLNITKLQKRYNTGGNARAAIDLYLPDWGVSYMKSELAGQTPYTYQLVPEESMGTPRPSLGTKENPMSEAEVLRVASGECIAWIHLLPPNIKLMLYGEATPVASSDTDPLTKVSALQSLYFLERPPFLVERVANAKRPGGPVTITEAQAKDALRDFKQLMADVWSEGWDDENSGLFEMTAFSDDAGAGGTFAHVLKQVSTDTVGLTIAYIVVIFVITMAFYVACDLVEMRILVAFIGTLMAMICVLGAMALTAIVDIKLNAVHMWCVPFLLLGVGIDDMFLVTNAATVSEGETSEEQLEHAMANVLSPISMTSLMNFILFFLMYVGTDIPGVSLAGVTGMFGIGMAYLTMITAYPCVVYLDIRRRNNKRFDCLCCMKSARSDDKPPQEANYGFRYAYGPALQSFPGRLVIIVAAAAILGVALGMMPSMSVGLDLSDFFPSETREGQYSKRRDAYFPVWPVRVAWGAIKYEDPDVQLHMALQWERMISTKHVLYDGQTTDKVWTAALAVWMLPCDAGSSCGPNVDPVCRSTLKPNTLGLRDSSEGGFCTNGQCPVMEGLTQEQISKCVGLWNAMSFDWALLSSGIQTNDEGYPNVPILSSEAGGSSLFAIDLKTNDDYQDLIRDTRKVIDEDDSIGRAFCYGIPYSFFEQYLTVVQLVASISGIMCGVGLVVAWLFLFVELSASGLGTVGQRILASSIGALIVTVYSGMAVLTTLGFNSVFDIQLNGFTAMAALLSLGMSVEYTVHVVHRFIQTDAPTALERILESMKFLFLPTFSGFTTTAISVAMLAFANFTFVRKYYFAPLAITTIVTYFYGVFFLPALLSFLGCIPVLKGREQQRKPVEPAQPAVIGSSEDAELNNNPAAVQDSSGKAEL